MKPLHSYLILAAIYISIMALGLHVGSTLLSEMEAGQVQPIVSKPDESSSSLTVFAYIIVMTAILLALLKHGMFSVIKILLSLSIFFGAAISLSTIFGYAGAPLALLPIFLLYKRQKNIWVVNTVLVLSLSGVGGLIGASLGTKPALILIVLLAVYDVVAVFGTKHMVKLAKGAKGRLPLLFSIPLFDSQMNLGTGDIAIPLLFTVSVLRDHTITHALLASVGGLFGLTVLFAYITRKGRVTLPALPPITAGLLLGYSIGFLI